MDEIDEYLASREQWLRDQRLAALARRCSDCVHYESLDSVGAEDTQKFRCLLKDEVFSVEDERRAATCNTWLWYELALRE